jgi:tripartite-type tricarboxylate transporter receptor subunit TctC
MKLPHRRQFLHLAAGAAALLAMSRIARAQTYPIKPIRLVVGFAAGTGPDIVARLAGQILSERLGQQVVVENRPGAGSIIATEAVVNAAPDGYTLLFVGLNNAFGASLYDRLTYDFVRDIAPVSGLTQYPNLVEVNPSFPAKTLPDLIAYAKANPGKINMASGSNGTAGPVAGELFKMMTGVEMVRVPYRGNTQALPDVLSGQVQVMIDPLPSSIEHIKAGRLRPLAVTTATRSDALPDVPTVGDFVPGYEARTWAGIGAPRATPVEIVDRLNRELNVALATPAIRARFAALGGSVLLGSPAEFGQLVRDETEKWGKVIRAANIKPD